MRFEKRILPVMLMALMALALALLPSAASADPPQADPTHTHSWQIVSGTATCTEGGIVTWKCAVCGKTYSEKVDALGHEWDRGTVTREPSGFTPGVQTFTCLRDSSHTYTEEIDPAPWLFARLQGGTPTAARHEEVPLLITMQPESGALTRFENGTCTLSVAVTGGIPPYTYAWYAQAQESWSADSVNKYARWFQGLFGVSAQAVDAALGVPLSTGSTCTVSNGDRDYWCVVTDRENNTVTTERAHVNYRLRIDVQPENGNLFRNGVVMLTCQAADGMSDRYDYRWYNEKNSYVGKSPSFKATSVGEYYCEVTDGVDTVTSDRVSVYYKKPFALAQISANCVLAPGTPAVLMAAFTGGTENYEIWWDRDGVAIGFAEGYENGCVTSSINTTESGVYTVHAVDALGEKLQASIVRKDQQLTVVRQPGGGVIPQDGPATVSVRVSGGEAPYTYTFCRNGGYEVQNTDESDTGTFQVWYPGEYYFRIEDSSGLSVESKTALFEDAVFRVRSQTNSAILAGPDGAATLTVQVGIGEEPYTYRWSLSRDGHRYLVGGDSSTVVVHEPGDYLCRIADQAGKVIYSRTIPVQYRGDAPLILRQPQGGELGEGISAIQLVCSAVSGSDANLSFTWERRETPGPNGWRTSSRQTGSTLTVSESGEYRCKVTDTVTGKSAYSEVAAVTQRLTFAGVKRAAISAAADGYTLSIKGGKGPYTVKIHALWPRRTEYGWEQSDAVLAVCAFDTLEELNGHRFDLASSILVTDPTAWSLRTGQTVQYYAVVYDGANHSCRSAVFSRDS